MAREAPLDETLRDLETQVNLAVATVERLRQEKLELQHRIDGLEQQRGQAIERINIILDRAETLR
jgi:phage shock protein A